MPYIVNFTDRENKVPITVFDNTSNADTSINFPGRNVTGYGQIIAENFLHLLENFSSAGSNPPTNPVEGQLWYNNTDGILQIWDNTQWKAASNIQKSTSEPSIETSRVGELWVDTTNQQLYVFSGSSWILVGPNFSTGLRSGPVVESVIDSDNFTRVILTFFIDDEPIIIISKDSFTPKNSINGFTAIKTGFNITTLDLGEGGFLPKFYGTAVSADSLVVGGISIAANKFLRSDTINTTEQSFNIRNNTGLTLGVDGTFSLSTSSTAAKIYNATPGSSIDIQTNRNGVPETVLKVVNNFVGINVAAPDESLVVSGNIKTDGNLILTNTTASTNFNNGSLITSGGVAVAKNILVGTTLEVYGQTTVTSIEPRETNRYDNGSITRRWNVVRTKTLVADTIVGALEGNIIGNATTATNLRFPTTFRMQGDVTSASLTFDGQVGGTTKTFETTITSGIISAKVEPSPNRSASDDFVLVFRAGQGLLKQTRDVFVGDLGIPVGTILPYAGAVAPYGYLLCDGGEQERAKYRNLYNVIGDTYGTPFRGEDELTFVLPDMRGRFPLGKHDMDNANIVPLGGGFIDGGGGLPSSESIPAGNFVIGRRYTIASVGTTNWSNTLLPTTWVGASSSAVGTVFTATSAGTGTGTATLVPRVDDTQARTLGGNSGDYRNSLSITNLPQHEHNFKALDAAGTPGGNQYHAVRLDTASPSGIEPGEGAFLGRGPTTPGQMQYLPSSGGVSGAGGTTYTTAQLGQSFSIMNPYLTLNYIIRSGPPIF
jgi:microcystin-dependent protein